MGTGEQEREQSPNGRHSDVCQNEHRPLERAEHRIENAEDEKDGQRYDDKQPRFGTLLAFIFACPIDVIPSR